MSAAGVALGGTVNQTVAASQDTDLATAGVQTDLQVTGLPPNTDFTLSLASSKGVFASQSPTISTTRSNANGVAVFPRVTIADGQRWNVRSSDATVNFNIAFAVTGESNGGGGGGTAVNRAPVASAGSNRTVDLGPAVTLAGSGTDADGDALTYQWTHVSGPAQPTLSGASTASASFTPTAVGAYVLRLTVRDPSAAQSTADVTITVRPANRAPTVSSTAQRTVAAGASMTLTAAGTDPDGDALTYSWTQLSGTQAALTGAGTASASFTPAAGLYEFRVSASDGRSGVATADVSVLAVDLSSAVQADLTAANNNLIAFHKASGSKSAGSCQYCHGAIVMSKSLNPAIEAVHFRHTFSGTGPKMQCTACHSTVDLLEESGAHIRKQVSMSLCYGCHSSRFFAGSPN